MPSDRKGIREVVVTGAAGAVGRHIVAELLAGGYRVRGVDIRRPAEGEMPGGGTFEMLVGDLADPALARRAVRGADAVINAAALVDIGLERETLWPLNVDAVGRLYREAAGQGARVFVQFSSGSVYGSPDGEGRVTEDTPLVATNDYERSKIESERLLEELHADLGLEWIVVRPSMIYGPGARFLAAGLAAVPPLMRFSVGRRIPALRGGPRSNFVHSEDVGRAVVFLMQRAAGCRAYNVADPTPIGLGDIVTAAMEAWGIETRGSIGLPRPGLTRAFRPLVETDLFFGLLNAPIAPRWQEIVEEHGLEDLLEPRIDRESAPYMFQDTIFSVDRLAVRGFRWKHPDLRESIGEVVRWYEDRRWIPRIEDVRAGGGRLPRLGFRFTETMKGSVQRSGTAPEPPADADRPFVFTVTARAPRMGRFLSDWETRLDGTVTWDGVVADAPLEGVLRMPLHRRKLEYDFTFGDGNGGRYRFTGRKDVLLRHPLDTMTTLPGKVTDHEGSVVGEGVARFDLRRDLVPMMTSFALA